MRKIPLVKTILYFLLIFVITTFVITDCSKHEHSFKGMEPPNNLKGLSELRKEVTGHNQTEQ